jgi:hypothetical protein
MITKIEDCEIKYQPNIDIFFLIAITLKRLNETNYKIKILIKPLSKD